MVITKVILDPVLVGAVAIIPQPFIGLDHFIKVAALYHSDICFHFQATMVADTVDSRKQL